MVGKAHQPISGGRDRRPAAWTRKPGHESPDTWRARGVGALGRGGQPNLEVYLFVRARPVPRVRRMHPI